MKIFQAFCGSATAAVVLIAGQILTRAQAETQSVGDHLTSITATVPTTSHHMQRTPVRVPGIAPAIITGPLLNGGGPVQTAPVVYVVYWGWTSDPSGEQVYLNDFLSTVGGTSWLNTVTQYSGAGNRTSLFSGYWSDPTAVPAQPTQAQIQSEALAAIHHFALGTSVNIEIVVATPTGHSQAGFGTQFCAYHGAVSAYPNVTYTYLPYITDAGTSCGKNSVSGPLDGVSIVAGHELAESITDPLLNAWKAQGATKLGTNVRGRICQQSPRALGVLRCSPCGAMPPTVACCPLPATLTPTRR